MFAVMGLTTKLIAQEKQTENKTIVSIETDPSTFLFNGFAAQVRIKPKESDHWIIGAGVYALDFPSFLVDLNKNNKTMGWKVRVNSAYSFFSEYYLKEANQKWFVGAQAGIQNFKNTYNNVADLKMNYSDFLLMPSIGYNWHPFKIPLYIKPWLGLGFQTKISGSNTISNRKYDISPFVPFLTFHIGYTINQ